MNLILNAVFVSLVCLAQDSETISVKTKEGKTMSVEVLGVSNGTAELKWFGFGGEVTLKRSVTDFTPESAFAIELSAAKPQTFEQHLALAKRAAELELLPQAGKQARAAIQTTKDDPQAEAKQKQVHTWAADTLEKMIREAVAANNLERANRCFEILTTRLPDQRTEAQLKEITELVNGLRERVEATKAELRAAKVEAKQKAEIKKALEPIMSKKTEGDKALSDAISQSNNTVASSRSSENAVEAYKASWKRAKELSAKFPKDTDLQQELESLIEGIEQSAIRAALHAANVLTLQSNYRAAADWVNRILKFDPDNSEAKNMLQTIQLANAASGNDYRYGWSK